MKGVRVRVSGLGFKIWGFGFRVWGLGLRVKGLGLKNLRVKGKEDSASIEYPIENA